MPDPPALILELINTGAEIMRGDVLNTHHAWLARQLLAAGFRVARQSSIDDRPEAIRDLLATALRRADVILMTGGLGPTSDDRTRDAVAALLGRKLMLDPETERRIADFFAARGRPMPPATRVQALAPENALILANHWGTAPGLILEVPPAISGRAAPGLLILLPGPPRELQPMFSAAVLPLLQERYGHPTETSRVLRTTGLGESLVEAALQTPLASLTNAGLEIGYCARVGEVDVRLAASGVAGRQMVREADAIVRRHLADYVFGDADTSLEAVVLALLRERRSTLSVAESCTGGYLAHRLTNVPGASESFWGGAIVYANEAKLELLGLPAATLDTHGAVSESVARILAEHCRARSRTDYALAITGIAGPAGGTPEKPVGTAFIGLAHAGATLVQHRLNPYDRETFKFTTTQQALDLLRRVLLGYPVSA